MSENSQHNTEPTCFNCKKPASAIGEYVNNGSELSPAEFAEQDGTYNPETNTFACTACYIEIGMPTTPMGWMAPA
jgi:hypothetical protein